MRFRNAIGFESLDILSQKEEEKRAVGCIYGLHLLVYCVIAFSNPFEKKMKLLPLFLHFVFLETQ